MTPGGVSKAGSCKGSAMAVGVTSALEDKGKALGFCATSFA